MKQKPRQLLAGLLALLMLPVMGMVASAEDIEDIAEDLSLGKRVTEWMDSQDELAYRVELTRGDTLSLEFEIYADYAEIAVYNEDGNMLSPSRVTMTSGTKSGSSVIAFNWNKRAEKSEGTIEYNNLRRGAYYIQVYRGSGDDGNAGSGKMTLIASSGTKKDSVSSTDDNKSNSDSLLYISISLKKGQTYQLGAKTQNISSSSLTWKSSNNKVATVSASGKVTAVAKGTAYITVSGGGKSSRICVQVTG